MGNTRPHDKDNPAAFTFLQEKDEFDINIGQDYRGGPGCNFMSLPNTLLPVIPPVESMQQEITQTSGRMMADFTKHNSLQNSRMEAIAKNISSNQLRTGSVSDVSFPECNARGVPHYPNQDFMSMSRNNAMDRVNLNSIQEQPANRNFLLKRNAAGGYQMVRQAGVARNSNINRPLTNGDFGSIGGNSYMMSSAQNNRQPQLGNLANFDKEQLGLHEKFDEKFSSLGYSASAQKNGQPQLGNLANFDKEQLGLHENFDEKFDSLGYSASMLPFMQHSEHTHMCGVVNEDGRGVQEKIDGSFLSLGIGGKQTMIKPKHSSREIANKLEEAAPPSHVQQTIRTSSSLGKNLDAGIPSFQTNAGGFLNPMYVADSRTLSSNYIDAIRRENGGADSSPLQVMQTPRYAMQQYMPMPDSNLSTVSDRNVGYTELDYRTLQYNQPGPSWALGNNLAGFVNCRQVSLPGPTSESANPAMIPSRTPLDMHNLFVLSAQRAAESAVNSHSLTLGGSSTRSNRPGPSIAGLDYGRSPAAQNSGMPQNVRAQPPGKLLSHKDIAFQASGDSLFPQKIGVPLANNGGAQGASSVLFPRRLGVEANAHGVSQVAEKDPLCTGKLYQPSEMRPNLLPNNLLTVPPTGCSEGTTHIQYPANLRGPSNVAGRSQDVPVQFSKGPPGSASMNGQVIPVATAHSQPSLKRSAMWTPPAPRWVQRQKIEASTIAHSHLPVPPIQKTAPTVSRIKWEEGNDGTPQPTGERCYICKRDVSFTADGPVYQPAVPPAVAVLPCGHTFHDQCLNNITPEDQSKEPPCIPCAVGEN